MYTKCATITSVSKYSEKTVRELRFIQYVAIYTLTTASWTQHKASAVGHLARCGPLTSGAEPCGHTDLLQCHAATTGQQLLLGSQPCFSARPASTCGLTSQPAAIVFCREEPGHDSVSYHLGFVLQRQHWLSTSSLLPPRHPSYSWR